MDCVQRKETSRIQENAYAIWRSAYRLAAGCSGGPLDTNVRSKQAAYIRGAHAHCRFHETYLVTMGHFICWQHIASTTPACQYYVHITSHTSFNHDA